MCQILKISAACYDEVLFLTPHCNKVLQYFIISIFLFTLSRALRPSLFLVSLSLSSEPSIALQNMPPSLFSKPTFSLLIIIIAIISILTVWSEYSSSTIRLPSDLYAISIPTCHRRSHALCPLLLSFSLSISCSLSTPSYSFFHFLSASMFPFLSAFQVCGSWVWPGCNAWCGWAVVLFHGSWSVSMVVWWVGFAFWYWWVLISVVLIDFGGFLISMAGFMGWSGWFRDGCGLIKVVLGLCCDLNDSLILWFFDSMALGFFIFFIFFMVAAMVGGCGGYNMDGWMWWPAVLG